jgi:hypothetical protein
MEFLRDFKTQHAANSRPLTKKETQIAKKSSAAKIISLQFIFDDTGL